MSEFDTKRSGIRVKILETGEVFNSTKACADRLGVHASQVGRVVRGDQGYRTCHGYHIVEADSDTEFDSNAKEHIGRPGIKVRIVETGETFDSIIDCAKAIKGNPGAIHRVLHKQRRSHRGLHFEFVY